MLKMERCICIVPSLFALLGNMHNG
jgi:hypothetical protein